MDGWGYSTRDVGELAGVSHGTVANWLTDSSRAGLDEVGKVAAVFGWTAAELLDGEPRRDVMLKVAELDAFRARARRLAAEIMGRDIREIDAASLLPVPRRSSE